MTPQQEKDFEPAVREHKLKIDAQIQAYLDEGLRKGDITEGQFEKAENGDLHFNLKDQSGTEIVYNVTRKTVYSYGGNLNQ